MQGLHHLVPDRDENGLRALFKEHDISGAFPKWGCRQRAESVSLASTTWMM